MKYSLLGLVLLLVACTAPVEKQQSPAVQAISPSKNEAVATFAEGCFWHSELVFESLKGVRDAVSGYAGGTDTQPNYEAVCSGSTGHAEAVQVFYDPQQISYADLVDAFFASHDPTTLNRQGNDEGTQYRSVAFYQNADEKKILEDALTKIKLEKKYSDPIVTEIKPLEKFHRAEDYHQDYIRHNPDNPYVEHVSLPDFYAFKKRFRGPFKP